MLSVANMSENRINMAIQITQTLGDDETVEDAKVYAAVITYLYHLVARPQ